MDKQGKVVIGVLVLIGVVFAMSLGTNLLPKPGVDQIDRRGWLASLDNLTARFREKITSIRLRPAADCKQLNGGYEFNRDAMECDVRGASAVQGDYQTGTLVVSNAASVWIPCENEQENTTSRGTAPGLRQLKVTPMQVIRPRPDRIDAGGSATGPNNTPTGASLEVVYTPEGEDSPQAKCQGENEIRLVVLKAGGRLSMRCTGCSGSQVVQVRFKE
jgi:hypothetical protein